MRNLLKIAAVLVLSFAAYYLVMGGSMLMSQGQLSQAMVDFSKEEESKLLEAGEEIEDGAEVLDVASASHAVLVMALTMLAGGLVEGLAGLFGLLGGKRRRLLIVSIVFAGVQHHNADQLRTEYYLCPGGAGTYAADRGRYWRIPHGGPGAASGPAALMGRKNGWN